MNETINELKEKGNASDRHLEDRFKSYPRISCLSLFEVSLSPLKEMNGLILKIGQCNSH
jgi:hypothetical protein